MPLVFASLLVCATTVPVEPGALYLNKDCTDVQFLDAAGRPLAAGWYPKAKYVTAPPDAASVKDAVLEKIDPKKLVKPGLAIDHPSFFPETSKILSNDGRSVEVGPRGYAISILLPAAIDVRFSAACARLADDYQRLPYHVYYDRNLDFISSSFGHQSYRPPKNVVYQRIHCVWGPHNRNFRPRAAASATFRGCLRREREALRLHATRRLSP